MIWRSQYHRRIAQFADFFTYLFGFFISYLLLDVLNYYFDNVFPSPFDINSHHIIWAVLFSSLAVYVFNKNKAYSYQRFTSLWSEFVRSLKVAYLVIIGVIIFTFISKDNVTPRAYIIICFGVFIILSILQKSTVYYLAKLIRKKGRNRKRIILIGTGKRAGNFIDTLNTNFSWGLDVIGIITADKSKVGSELKGVKIIDEIRNIDNIFKNYNPEEVIITLSNNNYGEIKYIIEKCKQDGIIVRMYSDFLGSFIKDFRYDTIYNLNIISLLWNRHSEIELITKRSIDIIGAILAIIIFSPLMIVAAIGIWITDGRPIIYNWNVVGFNKIPFRSWKFRTMVRNADNLKKDLLSKNEMDGPVFKIKNDPRIFSFGRWLRIWSIDETPQLFSVLKGDMSLVGPRPAGIDELKRYELWHRRKLSIKPGITCLWQATGRNGIHKFDDWVKLDLEYIDNWSLMLDIKILLKTIPAVLFGRGAR